MAEESLNGTDTLPEYATDFFNPDPRSYAAISLQAASMVVITIVALGGNLLILVAIYIDKTLQTITNVFIINLACADLLLAIIGMPFTLASSITYDWIFGDIWCKVNGMANSLFCIASILTLAAVSIDRYFAILYPFKYITWITNKVAAGMLFYIWFHASLMACLPLTSWSRYTFIRSESICTVQWEYSITFTLFLFSVCFFAPLGVMMFTYVRIFRTAKKHSRKIVPVTGEIEERNEPSTSEFNSCYESPTNNAGLHDRCTLSTKEPMNKSGVSLNNDAYDYDKHLLLVRQTAFTVFDEQKELGEEVANSNTEGHQLSKDSGCEEAMHVGASNLLRPSESSDLTACGRTSSTYDSVDAVSVLNSSSGSFQDSVFEGEHNEPPSCNNKGSLQCASTQNDTSYVNAPFAKSNKGNAYRKTGVLYLPPIQTATRKEDVGIVKPTAVSETLNNNNISINETIHRSDAKCVDENSPTVDRNAKNEDNSEDNFNQSNYLSVSRNAISRSEGIETETGDNKPLNIVVSRSSSRSSFSHPAKGVQQIHPESQTDVGQTSTATRKKALSIASFSSLVPFSKPNTFRAFSKSSLALMKLRKKKDVQARAKMRRETKAAKTLLIVVGTFVLCWTPHFIGIFCFLIKECSWPDEFFAITTWLAMLNSACNPVIYGVMSRQFRKRFKQILQCKRGFF